jgi:hypothetical protein
MLQSVNDFRVLHRYVLYKQVQLHGLFDITRGSCKDEILPYLFGDKGYPLINWIMTPFKEDEQHNILELFYNIKHKKGQSVVDNAFGILKKTFKELMHKLDLSVTFLPNISTCCLLHNLLKTNDEANIEHSFCIIELEVNNSHENQLVNIVQDD